MPDIRQVCVFAQNKPGKIERITGILAAGDINILSLSISGSNGFGVIRLIADEPEKAAAMLEEGGLLVTLENILAIEMEDRPGGLHRIVGILSRLGINIESATVLVPEKREKAYLVVEAGEPEETGRLRERLEGEGLVLLGAGVQGNQGGKSHDLESRS